MTFTFRAYHGDDSILNHGKKRSKLILGKNKGQALERFKEKFGINPLYAVALPV